ncbi:MAG: Helix-turn-helix domain protein [Planctomycetaceae bacterium]|nr:Helix-turn-helix domain protein [Planctomycetaceae bacterium]
MRVGDTNYVTPKDIADRYGINQSKVLTWIASGELIAINTVTRRGDKPRWKIAPSALATFEAGRSSKPPVATPARRQRTRDTSDDVDYFK